MPESFSPELFSEETRDMIRELRKKGDVSSNAIAEAMLEDVDFVGSGGRVVVARIEGGRGKLAAVSRKEVSPEEAVTVYYNQALLRMLFPDNFPEIYASYGKSKGKGVSVNFREEIIGRAFTKQETKRLHDGNTEKDVVIKSKEHPFSKVLKAMQEMQIPIVFDKNERNYMVGPNDEEYFVDTINFRGWTEVHKTNWLEYMKREGYPQKEIERSDRYISRIMTANQKEKTGIEIQN